MAAEFKKTSTAFQDSIWKTMGDDAWGDKFRKAADTAIAKSKEMAAAAASANKKTTQVVKASNKALDDELKKIAERGKAITQEVKTPMEQFRDKLADIAETLGKGQITRMTAIRATNKAAEELKDKEPVKFAGALDVGSTEARSAILAAISGRGSKEDAIAKNTGDTAAILRRIEQLQDRANVAITKEEMAMF
jgi:gas vesicle protein